MKKKISKWISSAWHETRSKILCELELIRLFDRYQWWTLSEFVHMENIGYRYVIQYFHLKSLSPTSIKAELDCNRGETAL